jgi:thiol:disulfide interchange protein
MSKNIVIFVGIVLVSLYFIAMRGGSKGPVGDIAWSTEPAAALKSVSQPTILVFTASWCPPCQEMKRSTWPDATVATAMKSYQAVWVNIDANGPTAQKFGIESIPTMVKLDAKGNEVSRQMGFVPAQELVSWLRR